MSDKEHVTERSFPRWQSPPLPWSHMRGVRYRHWMPVPLLAWRHGQLWSAAGAAAWQGRKAFLGIDLFLLSGKRHKVQRYNACYSGQCWNCQRNWFFSLLPSTKPSATTLAPSHLVLLQFLAHVCHLPLRQIYE